MRRDPVPMLAAYAFAVILAALVMWANWASRGSAPMVLAMAAVIVAAWFGGLGPGLLETAMMVSGMGFWLMTREAPEPVSTPRREVFRLTLLVLEGILFSLTVYRLNHARERSEAVARESGRHLAASLEAEERLRLVLDHMPASVFMKGLDGRYLVVNPCFVGSTGLSSEEVVGRTDEEIWPMEVARAFQDQDREALGSGPVSFEDRLRVGEEERVVLTTRFPMIDCLGHPYSICGLMVDITDRHRLETELTQARDAAEAANRAKDRFLAVLSHELRTPLTPALVAVSGLLDGTIRDRMEPTLEMVRRNIELEAHLIDDLLDISQVVRGGMRLEPEILDAHAVLHQALEICRSVIDRAGLKVKLDLAAERRFVRADRARLLQLFWNLVHNAVKFSLDDGRFSVSSRSERDREGSTPGWLAMEFSDSGMGLAPEVLEKIFEPFEQAWMPGRPRLGGLGLGLPISRSIAEAHGGRLTASSPGLNLGTRFVLELPLAEGSDVPAVRGAERRLGVERPAVPLRILLVEDNADTLRYLDLVLSHMGHQVLAASTISAALDAAEEHAFDLVLSDIELPDGTGLELMRTIAPNRETPGIAMSGFGSEEDVRLSLSAGFSLHMTKPLDTSQLNQAIWRVAGAAARA